MVCVGGIVVSIAAFQAVDPGSIPGQRNQDGGLFALNSSVNCVLLFFSVILFIVSQFTSE